jgi:hypothetical protein
MVEETKEFKEINYRENASDCEIRGIVFDHPNVRIFFFDPYWKQSFYLSMTDVNQFVFSTNHVQNVVSKIHLFDTIEIAMAHVEFKRAYDQILSNTEHAIIEADKALLFVEPITGGDVIAQFRTLELFIEGETIKA